MLYYALQTHTHTQLYKVHGGMHKFDGRQREWDRIKTASTTLTLVAAVLVFNSKRATTKPRRRYDRCCSAGVVTNDAVIKSAQRWNNQRVFVYHWQRYSNQSVCWDEHHRHNQKGMTTILIRLLRRSNIHCSWIIPTTDDK